MLRDFSNDEEKNIINDIKSADNKELANMSTWNYQNWSKYCTYASGIDVKGAVKKVNEFDNKILIRNDISESLLKSTFEAIREIDQNYKTRLQGRIDDIKKYSKCLLQMNNVMKNSPKSNYLTGSYTFGQLYSAFYDAEIFAEEEEKTEWELWTYDEENFEKLIKEFCNQKGIEFESIDKFLKDNYLKNNLFDDELKEFFRKRGWEIIEEEEDEDDDSKLTIKVMQMEAIDWSDGGALASEKSAKWGGNYEARGVFWEGEFAAGVQGFLEMDNGSKIFAPEIYAEFGFAAAIFEMEWEKKWIDTEYVDVDGGFNMSAGKVAVEGEGKVQFVDDNGNIDVAVKAELEAEALAGSMGVSGEVDVLGLGLGGEIEVTAGIGAHANFEIDDWTITCDIGVAVGLGISGEVKIDIGGWVDAAAGWVESWFDW